MGFSKIIIILGGKIMTKKQFRFRIIAMFTAVVLSFSGMVIFKPMGAYAFNDNNVFYDEVLIEELNSIEPIKDQYNLAEADFSNLLTSERIPTYEYTNDGIGKMGYARPIYYNNELKLIMLETDNNKYQSVAVPKSLSESGNSLAMIYDNTGSYLFNGETFSPMFKSSVDLSNRKSINTISDNEKQKIDTADVKEKQAIEYTNNAARTQTYYILNVKYVPQGIGTEICWAAATAMIVNYKNGLQYNARTMAEKVYGSDYNYGLSPREVAMIMNYYFSIGYTFHSTGASQNTICTNIDNSNPIYGSFFFLISPGDGRYHAAVIYGYNIINGTIFIMDPEYGSTTGRMVNSQLTYTSPASGYTLTLNNTVSKNW